jgi:hypothetical protein
MIDVRHQSTQACIDTILNQPVGRALYYQATLTGRIGAVDCEGIADVLDVVRRDDQVLDITVIDIKASRRTSVSFCLQVAFYARLLKDALARAAVPVAFVRGAILAHGADEVRERRNLAPICQNLYRVASALGFAWREGELDFWQKFRARAFGYRRMFIRDDATSLFRQAKRQDEAGAISVEVAARFGTQIPLEYAYAAWGKLPAPEAASHAQRAQLRGFLGVTLDDICQLAAQRCRALHYLEKQFTYKNRSIDKTPFDLTRLDQVAVEPDQVPLHRSLEDFLLLEHHTRHQAAMLYLSQPSELRAQTGQTAVVRCERYDRGDRTDLGVFVIADVHGTPVSREEIGDLRLQEGTWVVVNSLLNDEGQPRAAWEIVRGRLGVIRAISDTQIIVHLQRLSFKPTPFRYPHRRSDLQPGQVYTLDEMVDDLNADKYLEACQHAASNPLYHWLNAAYMDPQAPKPLRVIRPARLRAGQAFADLAAQAQQPSGLTGAQRAMVGGYYPEHVLVVQGPPGTGKSHTLGLAILARAWALTSVARPFRVAVVAKTHAAVNIVLDSVARRLQELLATHGQDTELDLFKHIRIAKVCNDMDEPVPAGVDVLLTDGNDAQSASEQWQELLAEPLVIVGGTPGGLYRLLKQGAARGRQLNWSDAYFDLVVVDEASQMNLAEAVTAAAFLRDDGQFIAVGDHRQMPPILQHAWDQASRRVGGHAWGVCRHPGGGRSWWRAGTGQHPSLGVRPRCGHPVWHVYGPGGGARTGSRGAGTQRGRAGRGSYGQPARTVRGGRGGLRNRLALAAARAGGECDAVRELQDKRVWSPTHGPVGAAARRGSTRSMLRYNPHVCI